MQRPLRVYKPNAGGNGSAFQFSYGLKRKAKGPAEPVMFIEATKQAGPKPKPGSSESCFDWSDEKKTVVMMNTDELAQIVAFITGLDRVRPGRDGKPDFSRKFFHKHESGDKSITITKPNPNDENDKWQNWKISISKGKGDFIQTFMTAGEVYALKLLCEKIITEYFGRPILRK
jgi:hypothetical protein